MKFNDLEIGAVFQYADPTAQDMMAICVKTGCRSYRFKWPEQTTWAKIRLTDPASVSYTKDVVSNANLYLKVHE